MTQLIRGVEKEPIVAVIYGEPGVGKSTLAAGAPSPVFVGPERTKSIDALKFPRSTSHQMLLDHLGEIRAGKHDKENIRTVVLDAITSHERVICEEICKSEPGKSMETARKGYGKAWSESHRKLTEVRNLLDEIINQKEMNVLVLGHSIKTDFNDPILATSYQTYEMSLHKGKKLDHNQLFIDWASTVLFVKWKTFATEDGNYAMSAGQREIKTEFRPSWVAKNRYNFPETIMVDQIDPLNTFKNVVKMINDFYDSGAQVNELRNQVNIRYHQCKDLTNRISDIELVPRINAALTDSYNRMALDELNTNYERLKQIVDNQ